jgi:SAM-dependent methyltransferase
MYLTQRARNVLRGLLQGYASANVKRALWNNEFTSGRWDCLQSTPGDCVYSYTEKYVNNGSILDLGCGSGNTGNELDVTKYQCYTGVDISDAALEKARLRSRDNLRADKNHYFQSDILNYVPSQDYNVILFRDSIYYIPPRQIRGMLDRYAKCLSEGGVFIVRICDVSGKYRAIVDIIERHFQIVEKRLFEDSRTLVIAFRQGSLSPRPPSDNDRM